MKRHLVLITIGILASATVRAQVPQLINYQGRVAVGGVNFPGPSGQFKFAFVNAAGTTTFWSNDDSSVAGSQPTAAVTLPVANGLYSVLLGDTPMQPILATVFNNPDVRLRVWFSNGNPPAGSGFQQLTPDQRIAAVGYAMMAANVPDGAINGNKIAAGAVGNPQLAANAVQSNNIAAGTIVNTDIGSSAAIADTKLATIATPGKVADTALSANVALLDTAQTFTADKTFGASAQLLADIGSAGAPGMTFRGDPNTGIFQPSTNANTLAIATLGVERLRVDASGRVGIGTSTPANRLTVHTATSTYGLEHTNGTIRLGTYVGGVTNGGYLGTITNHKLSFFVNDGGASMTVDTTGNVGIGTSVPATPLQVDDGSDAAQTGGGYIVIGDIAGQNMVFDTNEIMARNNGGRADLYLNRYGLNPFGGAVIVAGCPLMPDGDGFMLLGSSGSRWASVHAVNGSIQTSDARFKENIQPLHYGLQTVLSLRPVSFEWKNNSLPGVHLGLISQEVETIVPEAVVKGEKPEHASGMSYSSFIPILIKAAQEQQTLIEAQRVENTELKRRLEAVESLFESIEPVGL